jgi:cobalt/nickel transport system ATP-binding protein
VEAIEVHYRFPDGRTALRGWSLTVAPGETVGLIGPNGAGKTTFFLAAIGLCQPHHGSLKVGGLDVTCAAHLASIRRRTGLVFQNADDQLFSATVYDDVAFGPLNLDLDAAEVRTRVDRALERVGACEHAARVSHHLSAGEKRRVALACVLAMEPDTLLLDEPTSDLDPRARRETLELIRTLEQTKLIASHDLEFVLAACDRIAVVDEGRIVADGPAQALLTDSALMEAHGLETPPSLASRARPPR